MTSLEELVLYSNDLSRDDRLSDTLSTLTSLKKLDMRDCKLSHLPAGCVDNQRMLCCIDVASVWPCGYYLLSAYLSLLLLDCMCNFE